MVRETGGSPTRGLRSTTLSRQPISEAGREFLVDPDLVYLNHGSFGACPWPVLRARHEWELRMERNPMAMLARDLDGALAKARGRLASRLGAGADDLVFVPNATFAVNAVARSLRLGPGDEVLMTDHEYGACERVFRFLAAERGFRIVVRETPLPLVDEDEWLEAFLGGLGPRTRLVFASHVTSPTALLFPARRLCEGARAAGIPVMIDGAHAPGLLDLDLASVGADYYTGNCHKWLCAPKGAAFLHARPEAQDRLEPLAVSWGWESEKPLGSRFQDLFGWLGTNDFSAYLSVPAALDFLDRHDWPAVRRACRALLAEAAARITALTGLEPLSSEDLAGQLQMRSFPLPPGDAPGLQARLREAYGIEVPVVAWRGRRFLRVSVQAYNERADIDRLVSALGESLRAGA